MTGFLLQAADLNLHIAAHLPANEMFVQQTIVLLGLLFLLVEGSKMGGLSMERRI